MLTLNMENVTVILAGATLVVAVLAWRFPKARTPRIAIRLSHMVVYPGAASPTIQAVSGVPTSRQLVEGVEIGPRTAELAQRLYETGLEQFNHYVNNRDGIIEESRRKMNSLSGSLSQLEVSQTENIGISLATASDEEQRQAARSNYDLLAPQAQIYAEHKRRELQAQQTIARDLEKDVPRTDYTAVKSRIAAGNTTLASITSELPIPWQSLRTLNNRIEAHKPTGKPPKREFLHVMFFTKERGLLEDKKAERDGNWIISNKHDMLVPYQEPIPLLEFVRSDAPPVQTGRVVVIDQDPTSEWETEFWRQGGFMDQVYLRARTGTLPEQLRKAYRRRQFRIASWVSAGVMVIVNIVLVASAHL